MTKKHYRFKIRWYERFQYIKNGYTIGNKWIEKDHKGLIRYYCYAYKKKKTMGSLM